MWVLFNNCKVCSTVLTRQEGSVSEWWLKLLTPRPGSVCSRGRGICILVLSCLVACAIFIWGMQTLLTNIGKNFTVDDKALVHLCCTAYPIITLSLCHFLSSSLYMIPMSPGFSGVVNLLLFLSSVFAVSSIILSFSYRPFTFSCTSIKFWFTACLIASCSFLLKCFRMHKISNSKDTKESLHLEISYTYGSTCHHKPQIDCILQSRTTRLAIPPSHKTSINVPCIPRLGFS